MRITSPSPAKTKAFAAALAKKIIRKKGPVIVALQGELGAGKTTFAQGFIRALGVRARVKSPTFLVIKSYPLRIMHRTLFHIDCYRVKNHRALLPLDSKNILKDPSHIILIEWPERITPILPRKKISVRFTHTSRNERIIHVTGLETPHSHL